MITQVLETVSTPVEVVQPAEVEPVSAEAKLEALAEDSLLHDEDLASFAVAIESYFKARDKRDFETALDIKKSLIETAHLWAMGSGITKKILDSHYSRIAA